MVNTCILLLAVRSRLSYSFGLVSLSCPRFPAQSVLSLVSCLGFPALNFVASGLFLPRPFFPGRPFLALPFVPCTSRHVLSQPSSWRCWLPCTGYPVLVLQSCIGCTASGFVSCPVLKFLSQLPRDDNPGSWLLYNIYLSCKIYLKEFYP